MSKALSQPGFLQRVGRAFDVLIRGDNWGAWRQVFGEGGGGQFRDRPTTPYSQVAVVFTCVQRKADAMARMAMMVSTTEDQIIEAGPLVQISQCPNPAMTWRKFARATSAYLDLFGRVAWRIEAPAGVPSAVWPLMPARLFPVRNEQTGELIGWRYRHASGRDEPLTVEEVHYFNDPDFESADELSGMAPRLAVGLAIEQYYRADLANLSSLNNSVEPGGAFRFPGRMTDAQRGDLKDTIQDNHGGPHARRRFMVLEDGAEWQQIETNLKDLEFIAGKAMNRTDICAAYGVPPAVAGFYEDSNYAHAEAANSTFWTGTILPRAEWIAEEWTRAVLSRFENDRTLSVVNARRAAVPANQGKARAYIDGRRKALGGGQRYFGWMDAGGVEAVQRANLAIAEHAKEWVGMGVPLNEILRATNAPFQEVPWGDTWHRPAGLIDVRNDQYDDPPTPGPGSSEDDPADLPEDGVDSGGEGGEGAETPRGGRPATRTGNDAPNVTKAADAALAALWERWRASWRGLESATRQKTRRHFNELRREVLRRFDENYPQLDIKAAPSVKKRDLIGQILFDLVLADGAVRVKVGPLIREAFELGGQQATREAADAQGVDKPQSFNLADPGVAAKLRRRDIKLTDMNRTLRRQLADTMAEGIDAGETHAQVRERIKHKFNLAHRRAESIARTEIGAAVEEARHEGHKQAGVPLKSWLWSRKETGRAEHQRTEQATTQTPIPMEALYTIAGTDATCLHPRGTGRPEQDINCGCTSVGRFPGDSLKAVLDRYARRGFLTYEQLRNAPGSFPGSSTTTQAA